MQHLDEGTIHAWLDGALDAEESARAEQHAASCASCAAAVAEARGLVAGASRILGSLDDVPSGVVPGSAFTQRRSRSLWTRLHLSPARAAAAAVLIVAVGTTLVLRQAPNEGRRAALTSLAADTMRHSLSTPTSATPAEAAQPEVAASISPSTGVASRAGRPASGPAAKPAQLPDKAQDAIAVAAAPANVADSVAVDRLTMPKKETPTLAQPMAAPAPRVAEAAKTAASAGVGGVATAFGRGAGQSSVAAALGCYAVTGDSVPGLPQQIQLDSTRLRENKLALSEVVVTGVTAGAQARRASALVNPPPPAAAQSPQPPRSSWYWEPRLAGGILLRIAGTKPALVQLDSTTSSAEWRGVATIDGRPLTIVLHRVECPPK
jgi:anti-sigma factor RsiW